MMVADLGPDEDTRASPGLSWGPHPSAGKGTTHAESLVIVLIATRALESCNSTSRKTSKPAEQRISMAGKRV